MDVNCPNSVGREWRWIESGLHMAGTGREIPFEDVVVERSSFRRFETPGVLVFPVRSHASVDAFSSMDFFRSLADTTAALHYVATKCSRRLTATSLTNIVPECLLKRGPRPARISSTFSCGTTVKTIT